MTSAAVALPNPIRAHLPNPGDLARNAARFRALHVVPHTPAPGELPPAREYRPEPGAPAPTPAQLRDRAQHAECRRGAHEFVTVPVLGGRTVCLHCPTYGHQAATVGAARRMNR